MLLNYFDALIEVIIIQKLDIVVEVFGFRCSLLLS